VLRLELLVVRFDLLLSRSDLVAFPLSEDTSNASLYILGCGKSSALDSLERNDREPDN